MMSDSEIGKAIRRERILFAVTQHDLAKAIRMKVDTLIQFELGKKHCSERARNRICWALGITRERLEGRSEVQVAVERARMLRRLRDAYGEQYEAQVVASGF